MTSVSWQWISAVSLPPQSSVCTVSAPDPQLQRAVFEIFPNTVIFLLHREHGTWNVSDNNWMSSRGLSRMHWQRSYLKLSVISIESKLHGHVMRTQFSCGSSKSEKFLQLSHSSFNFPNSIQVSPVCRLQGSVMM